MSGLPLTLQIIVTTVSLLILLFTAGIKLEEYLKKRHERLLREEIHGFKVFLGFAEKHADEFDDIDQGVIDDLEKAHDQFEER
jgi:hypothetical protein